MESKKQCVCVSPSFISDSVWPHGLQASRLLCPWDFFLGKNTGVGSHSLLQGIFPTQDLNPGLLHCRQIWATREPSGIHLCMCSFLPGHKTRPHFSTSCAAKCNLAGVWSVEYEWKWCVPPPGLTHKNLLWPRPTLFSIWLPHGEIYRLKELRITRRRNLRPDNFVEQHPSNDLHWPVIWTRSKLNVLSHWEPNSSVSPNTLFKWATLK